MPKLLTRPASYVIPLIAALVSVPFSAFAATGDFFGPIIPQAGDVCYCADSAMDWGCVLQVIQSGINMIVSFGVLLVILMIAYGGFTLLTSGSNPSARTAARNRLLNAVIGLVVVLCAWLVVDYVMKVLYDPTVADFGPWNSILAPTGDDYCITPNTTSNVLTTDIVTGVFQNPGTGGSSTGTSGTGTCKIPTGGQCTTNNLSGTFGSAASQAAMICSAESGNNPQRLSRSDVLADGRSYSVGLFQINLTNSFNYKVNGQNCSAAFSNPCQGRSHVVQSGSSAGKCDARVVNDALYRSCVAAAQTPSINIGAAKALYNGSWSRWSTAKICHV